MFLYNVDVYDENCELLASSRAQLKKSEKPKTMNIKCAHIACRDGSWLFES